MQACTNALSIDVEDYFHVAALAESISVDDWDKRECRVEQNTHRLLDLFDKNDSRSTFFILGWVAERYPKLIQEIHQRGHEIASHGFSHQLVYSQSPEVFKEETYKSKQILEDLIQAPVLGYRAASYSITKQSLWALDILVELGFEYDSSIFPIKHDRYGISDARQEPHVMQLDSGGQLVEFPLSTAKLMGMKVPIAGGGYFRIFPFWFFKYLFKQAVNNGPAVFYLHPWEIDPEQPKVEASWLSTFRHYRNLDQTEIRLTNLLQSISFMPMKDVLTNLQLLNNSR